MSSPADETTTLGWQERSVAAVFGLGMVAVGPLLWLVLQSGGGRLVAPDAGATLGLFGAPPLVVRVHRLNLDPLPLPDAVLTSTALPTRVFISTTAEASVCDSN